jgi:hypothetical protein
VKRSYTVNLTPSVAPRDRQGGSTFNTAPLGVNDRRKASKHGEPKAPLTSFRSPEDLLSALFSPDDIEVSNIQQVEVEGGALAEVLSAGYKHSMAMIARPMQEVRLARDEGWIAAYLAETN